MRQIKTGAPSLFIFGTPFQALCAIEAIHEFQITDYKVLLGLINTPRNQQLFTLLRQYNISYEIANIDYTITKLDRIKAFIPRFKKYKNIFVGDANNELYQYMAFRYGSNGSTVIYLDDGAGSISFLSGERKLEGKLKYYYKTLSLLRNIDFNKKIFTIYDGIGNDRYEVIPSKFKLFSSQQDSKGGFKNVIIAGTTVNKFYVAPERLLDNMNGLFNSLRDKYPNEEIIYVPHGRDTSVEWLEVCQKYRVDVVRPEVSIELYIMSLPYYPKEVYGYTSSALFNIKLICPKTRVCNILINENIPKVYHVISDYYQTHGIEKIVKP